MLIEKMEAMKMRYQELSLWLSQPDAVADQAKWRGTLKEQADMEEPLAKYEELCSVLRGLKDAAEAMESEEPELVALGKAEHGELSQRHAALEEELRILLLPKDPNDEKSVILEIRAGTGGEEAALFGMDLLKMYTRYADKQGWRLELTDLNDTEIGGCKEATCLIEGRGAFSRLKFESGAHRVQRVPDTESSGRIHTSAATVAVLPETEDVELDIQPNDLRIDTYRASGAGGQHVNRTESAIRITHIPTGVVVTCQDEKSQIKNREKAMRVLRSRIFDAMKTEKEAEYAAVRRGQVGSGDRNERIRTYNFPQGRVTDHRIGLTLYKLDEFMQGDMDAMLDPLILADRQERMQRQE